MRKTLLFLTILFLFILLAGKNDGFDLYVKKDYKGAYNAFYEKFINSEGDPLYSYNLAVTSAALGKKGEAIYFYIQSLQRAPEFSEAKNNLNILAREMEITIPKTLLEPAHAVDYLLVIFFISMYVFSFFIAFLCYRNDWRIKTALVPVFLIMIVFATLYFIKYQEDSKINWAVVVNSQSLKSGPDESLTEIGKVKEGEIINIVSSSGSWYKVKSFQDNVEGWIKLNSIRAVMRGHI